MCDVGALCGLMPHVTLESHHLSTVVDLIAGFTQSEGRCRGFCMSKMGWGFELLRVYFTSGVGGDGDLYFIDNRLKLGRGVG